MSHLSRRGFLHGVAAAAGGAAASRLPWADSAFAQAAPAEKSAVVVIFLLGGYNSLFCSADSFLSNGAFGVNNGNVTSLGNGLVVDKATLGSLPEFARTHMATIGNRHGSSDHAQANVLVWSNGASNYAIKLAAAMGGPAAIKCAAVGEGVQAPQPAEGGVSLQSVVDMSSTIEALVGGDQRSPDRIIASKAMLAAKRMTTRTVQGSPEKGKPLDNGFDTSADGLKKTPPPFDYKSLPAVYGANTTQVNNSFATKLAAAELMVRAGTNVVAVYSPNDYDNHGVRTPGVGVGTTERNLFGTNVIPHLTRFLERMHDPAGLGTSHNVVTVIVGDFARSLPGGDHQPNLSATVIGKHVKVGTTGRVSANVGLPANSPASEGMWAYIAAAAKVQNNPFGANPHPLIR